MTFQATLLLISTTTFLLNIPFGYWRAGVKKFTLSWFLAIHIPVPFVVGLRLISGLGWNLTNVPVLLCAFFAGQFLGGKLKLGSKEKS